MLWRLGTEPSEKGLLKNYDIIAVRSEGSEVRYFIKLKP
jgi:hypothetical protein